MPFYQWREDALILHCLIQPGAKHQTFCGEQGDRLKIRLQSPPVDGQANKALIALLADSFKVRKQQVTILSGETSRQKTVAISAPRHLPQELAIQARAPVNK